MFAGRRRRWEGGRLADRLCMLSNAAAGMAAIVGPLNTIGSRRGGGRESGGGEMSFFKRKSRLQPDDFTRKSPIVHYLAGTWTLIKSGRPPTRSRPDFLSLPICLSVRTFSPFIFQPLFALHFPPERKDKKRLIHSFCCVLFVLLFPIPGCNNRVILLMSWRNDL